MALDDYITDLERKPICAVLVESRGSLFSLEVVDGFDGLCSSSSLSKVGLAAKLKRDLVLLLEASCPHQSLCTGGTRQTSPIKVIIMKEATILLKSR